MSGVTWMAHTTVGHDNFIYVGYRAIFRTALETRFRCRHSRVGRNPSVSIFSPLEVSATSKAFGVSQPPSRRLFSAGGIRFLR